MWDEFSSLDRVKRIQEQITEIEVECKLIRGKGTDPLAILIQRIVEHTGRTIVSIMLLYFWLLNLKMFDLELTRQIRRPKLGRIRR